MNHLNTVFIALIFILSACVTESTATFENSLPPIPFPTADIEGVSPISTITLPPTPQQPTPFSTAVLKDLNPVPTNPPATDTAVPASPIPSLESQPAIETKQTTPSPEPPLSLPPAGDVLSPNEAVAAELAKLIPPARDDLRLAVAFRGLTDTDLPNPPVVVEPLPVGSQQTFTIPNVVDNTVSEIEAELLAVGDHAYFWFDKGPGSVTPGQGDIAQAVQVFDEIYVAVVDQFGSERNPGIDGDPRLHIVHASPIALCGVTEETADECYLAGLVNSTDLLPDEIDPRSNEREMFVMNARRFGSDSSLGVLAHEFRHMIEDNYDKSDTDWEVEGSATLAAQLAGLPSGGVQRGNMFLEQPDQQLNSWTDDGTAPYYGQGYLFNRFVYDQLGQKLYREFATSPFPGLQALDAVTEAAGLSIDGQSLWLDYLVALAIHNDPQAPSNTQFESEGLNTATMTPISSLPASYQEQVSQYAADYYELPAGVSSIDFAGAADVSLLGIEPVSGERYWFAQRANYSNPRLTYVLDLRDLDQATLTYDVYSDIEQGYDFAYVSASVDDGRTWVPLTARQMQGLDPQDNPAGSALADRFYTGRSRQWINESIDLTPYVGQEIKLRFEYVTDPILTYGGLALDNIAVQELNFFDGAEVESDNGNVEGFARVTPEIPQAWHLQHITFEEDVPQIQYLAVDSKGEQFLAFESKTQKPSILIVAAAAPTTLEKAGYILSVDG